MQLRDIHVHVIVQRKTWFSVIVRRTSSDDLFLFLLLSEAVKFDRLSKIDAHFLLLIICRL